MTSTSRGEVFARALAAKDADGLRRVLQPELDFRAMTPGKFWEASDADTVIDDIVFGRWFEPTDEIRELIALETDTVGHRHRVGYRLRVKNADGEHVVEQQAYYELQDERISWLRIMCAGYMPVAKP
jgi:hypothetical protein